MAEVTRCGVCYGSRLYPLLDMGRQPLAEAMRSVASAYPLRLVECQECSLVQLDYVVDQRVLFPAGHPYTTGTNAAMRGHLQRLAVEILNPLKAGDVVVDIGANDGTLLRALDGHGARLVAVEPTDQARKCREAGFRTWQAFFTADIARDIVRTCGKAKAVVATNVLAHVPDPHDFVRGVAILLDGDGVLVTENHDVRRVTGDLQIDAVYHEHLRYYSAASLSRLLSMNGLEVTDVVATASYGGSLRTTARPKVTGLAQRASDLASRLHEIVAGAAAKGAVYGVGAATRATPLIYYAGLGPHLACVAEVAGSEKIGTMMPGTLIPVVDEKLLVTNQPPYALMFAWHIAGTIIPRLREAGYKGQFIIPLPEPRIADEQ